MPSDAAPTSGPRSRNAVARLTGPPDLPPGRRLPGRRADAGERALVAARLARVAHPAAVLDEPQRESRPTPRAAPSRRDRARSSPGSVSVVSFRRCDSRVTCVSTGRPGSSNHTDRTTLPVLRPTPGSVTRSSSSVGISPSKRARTACAMPMRFFAFERKKPVDWIDLSTSSGSATARSAGVGIPGEQRGRHHVHALVGALRRQDRRDEQLVRVRVVQRAVRVGIELREQLDDGARARLRTPGSGHGRTVPSPRDDRGRATRRARATSRRRRDEIAALEAAARAGRRARVARRRACGAISSIPAPTRPASSSGDRAYAHVARSDNARPATAGPLGVVRRSGRPRPTATRRALARGRRRARRRRTAAGARRAGCSARPAPTTTVLAAAGFQPRATSTRCGSPLPLERERRRARPA